MFTLIGASCIFLVASLAFKISRRAADPPPELPPKIIIHVHRTVTVEVEDIPNNHHKPLNLEDSESSDSEFAHSPTEKTFPFTEWTFISGQIDVITSLENRPRKTRCLTINGP
ncbi:hypothetical protein L218DRAFT_956835 [Marasmius fiardii PR-910]|nr:hypothetical protein L218DRAFT_956835 [Marasmius fiardii PR-910]